MINEHKIFLYFHIACNLRGMSKVHTFYHKRSFNVMPLVCCKMTHIPCFWSFGFARNDNMT